MPANFNLPTGFKPLALESTDRTDTRRVLWLKICQTNAKVLKPTGYNHFADSEVREITAGILYPDGTILLKQTDVITTLQVWPPVFPYVPYPQF